MLIWRYGCQEMQSFFVWSTFSHFGRLRLGRRLWLFKPGLVGSYPVISQSPSHLQISNSWSWQDWLHPTKSSPRASTQWPTILRLIHRSLVKLFHLKMIMCQRWGNSRACRSRGRRSPHCHQSNTMGSDQTLDAPRTCHRHLWGHCCRIKSYFRP